MRTTKIDQTFSNIVNQIVAGSIANIANGFLIDAQSRGLSPHTLRDYSNEIKALLKWTDAQGITMLDELTADNIRKYLLSLQERRNPGGQFAGYRVIRTFTYWWERETDGDYRSPIRKVKPPKVNPQPLPGVKIDAIQELLEACRGDNQTRDRSIILFLADTGVRASELCDLTMADVDLMTGAAIVRNGKGGKHRVVYIGQRSRRELRKYLKLRTRMEPDAALFATQEEGKLTYSGLRQIIRRRAAQAGIVEPGLHDFRRFFALSMLRNGADLISLSRLMGHSGITVLQRYLAQVEDDLQQVHLKAGPMNQLPK
ncbi:MAG: tyrosine-type recombinase/integrase [Chloroflexi bacterium]|nr:tyrosine-type recombinase/integrase [Chloroflexota bacterium]